MTDKIDLILIDDDELVRSTWLASAMKRGERLLALETPADIDDFDVDPTTPVYVDLRLADGVSGIDVANRLLSQGFERIYLTTGARAPKFETVPPSIMGVTGKEYPLLAHLPHEGNRT